MILWFGKKKKKDEMAAAGAAMETPELSAEELAAKEAAEAEAAKAAAEKEEIERIVAEANKAWEERQVREAQEAAAEAERLEAAARRAEEAAAAATAEEAARLAEEAEKARKAREERAAQQAKAEAELKLLADRREAERLRAEAEAAARAAMEAEANNPGFVAKLGQGLSRSSSRLAEGLAALGRRKLDDETLEELEDLLITSDLGAKVAARVAASLSKERFDKEITEEEIRLALASEISEVLKPREKIVDFSEGTSPRVVLFVGVNGSGKTTTIGKIASKLAEQGAKALLVAGDTFRAAAIEQLTVWGDRAGIPVMSKPTGADAAGLVYEAIEQGRADVGA
jgi:fused signal recognition particle receptor